MNCSDDVEGIERSLCSHLKLAEVLYNAGGGDRVAGRFADPTAALAAAARACRSGERILVFGSFHTVASVLALVADGAGPAGGDDR